MNMKDFILKTLIGTVIVLSVIYAMYYVSSPYENCMREIDKIQLMK